MRSLFGVLDPVPYPCRTTKALALLPLIVSHANRTTLHRLACFADRLAALAPVVWGAFCVFHARMIAHLQKLLTAIVCAYTLTPLNNATDSAPWPTSNTSATSMARPSNWSSLARCATKSSPAAFLAPPEFGLTATPSESVTQLAQPLTVRLFL